MLVQSKYVYTFIFGLHGELVTMSFSYELPLSPFVDASACHVGESIV